MVKNWDELKATGNPAVDSVMTVIWMNRRKMLPIRSLYLSFRAYGMFLEFVKNEMAGTYQEGQGLRFDGVDINCNPAQTKDIIEDYYPMAVA